jgi:hypothetical protein
MVTPSIFITKTKLSPALPVFHTQLGTLCGTNNQNAIVLGNAVFWLVILKYCL